VSHAAGEPELDSIGPGSSGDASGSLGAVGLSHLDVKTLKRYDPIMGNPKRATVYFEPDLHRALRLKAAASDRSISEMVNDAVKLALAEDAGDLEAFEKRKREPNLDFERFVKALRRRGKL
jgi:hypothetical protein